ncbi:alkaline-phosphatase-like protein [Cyathus striatus]|nr:alkaline-phosphatase-like protein [Cyathus striatus]
MKRKSATSTTKATAVLLLTVGAVSAQTFRRLGACPTLGCVFPPDQTDFLAGQLFDIRLEVHAPVNGSEAINNGVPDEKFLFCIQKGAKGKCEDVTKFFGVKDPELEKWSFSYYEDLFAQDAGTSTPVNVASKAYRALQLTSPGEYLAKLTYNNGSQTVAAWTVREPATKRKAKNVLFFIGDGMTQAMITAARLIAHKSINGKYQSLMQMDQMDNLGHQMTHSLDSFITDSANSATALYTGKKSTVNALNVYADSSPNTFDDPKFETIAELFKRRHGGPLGIVSTAYIADATPAGLCAHTKSRDDYQAVVYEYLNSAQEWNSTIKWPTSCGGADVVFGGGAEQFIPGSDRSTAQISTMSSRRKVSNMAKWIDRNVLPENLKNQANSPTGDGTDALDQPGLKEMTLKAIELLRSREKKDEGCIKYLKKVGEYDNTLIVVTADHGHGFDVFGGADTKYLAAQTDDRKKRSAVGVYVNSGLSGPNFPVQWNPRYAYAAGFGAMPDHRELYDLNTKGPRVPATKGTDGTQQANPADKPDGYHVDGTLPTSESQGVHSLQDVSVFANGPGSETFRGVYNSVDIFFKIADALALGSTNHCEGSEQ